MVDAGNKTTEIITAHNSRFAKAGVLCFYESEVLNSNFVHLLKFSAEKPRLRKAAFQDQKQVFSYLFLSRV